VVKILALLWRILTWFFGEKNIAQRPKKSPKWRNLGKSGHVAFE
jgi:hypothetical protein